MTAPTSGVAVARLFWDNVGARRGESRLGNEPARSDLASILD